MGIRDFLFGAPAKASIIGLPATEQPDKPLEKAFDDGTLLSVYRDDAWPYILANKVAEQASQAPLRLGTSGPDGDWEWAPDDHPVQVLLTRPNPMTDGGDLIQLLVLYMELVGHAPIEIVRDRRAQPVELWLHNPAPWRIVPANDGTIMGYLYLLERGNEIAWTPQQMTYTRWPDPSNRWYGQGRLAAVRQELMAEEYASVRDKKLEKNLGIPPGVLTSELPLGEATARELQMRWTELVGGYQNAGKVGVLGSKTTYQPIQLNAVDADWYKARSWRVEALAASFGVPMPLIRMEGATFSNAEQARAEFWEGTLQPRLNRIARMLTARLLPLLGSEEMELRFDYSQIEALGENDKEAAATAKLWAESGSVTVDEVRARLNLAPHDDPAIGARLLVPTALKLQSAEDISAPPEPPAPPPIPPQEEPEPEEEEQPLRPVRSSKAARDRDVILAPVRAAWNRDLSSYFRAQLGAILGAFGKSAKFDDSDIVEQITRAILAERFRERFVRISLGPISTSLVFGASDGAEQLGVATSFDIEASDTARELLTTHLERLNVQIQNTTNADVQAILDAGLRDGLSNEQIRANLSTLFDGYEDWRLDRITRTETTAAYNRGSIAQYREAGIQMVIVTDGDGDGICEPWNGREVTLKEADDNPTGHPNCTRTFTPDTSILRTTLSVAPFVGGPAVKRDDEAAKMRHDELMAALARPAAPVSVTIAEGAVSVTQPPIEVAAPVVNIEPAAIKVETPAPNVTVNVPDSLNVKVTEMPTAVRTVERDERGNITRVVES